ncbi:MAG: DUF3179 domain-containing protein [Deltaproteobacteria bacterium]|nr:DUF3179 domain-containing protein [Deltaproteobacteria bacterium]
MMFEPPPLLCALAAAASGGEPTLNGFDLANSLVPANEILHGGPERDAIPALDSPPVVAAAGATWRDDAWVVGVAQGSDTRAYPLEILVWHELVNDRLGGRPLLVSYCPLCGTALVFDRRVGGAERRFGVSGLLYRSDLLMFDRESESLWSQISAHALTGPARASRLTLVRSRLVRWADWKRAHPATTVLSRETGHARPYGQTPYVGYETSERLVFPVTRDPRYHPKMRILGLRMADGRARGYPLVEVQRAGGVVAESPFGKPVTIRLDTESQAFEVDAPEPVEVIESYWFAWAVFHPDASVYVAE